MDACVKYMMETETVFVDLAFLGLMSLDECSSLSLDSSPENKEANMELLTTLTEEHRLISASHTTQDPIHEAVKKLCMGHLLRCASANSAQKDIIEQAKQCILEGIRLVSRLSESIPFARHLLAHLCLEYIEMETRLKKVYATTFLQYGYIPDLVVQSVPLLHLSTESLSASMERVDDRTNRFPKYLEVRCRRILQELSK
jgi:hypothetical protein